MSQCKLKKTQEIAIVQEQANDCLYPEIYTWTRQKLRMLRSSVPSLWIEG